jgi:hypothetical protein
MLRNDVLDMRRFLWLKSIASIALLSHQSPHLTPPFE